MEELIREYGGVILAAFAGTAALGIAARLLLPGGLLEELLMKLGTMAC